MLGSILYGVVNEWNTVSDETIECNTLSTFKKKLIIIRDSSKDYIRSFELFSHYVINKFCFSRHSSSVTVQICQEVSHCKTRYWTTEHIVSTVNQQTEFQSTPSSWHSKIKMSQNSATIQKSMYPHCSLACHMDVTVYHISQTLKLITPWQYSHLSSLAGFIFSDGSRPGPRGLGPLTFCPGPQFFHQLLIIAPPLGARGPGPPECFG